MDNIWEIPGEQMPVRASKGPVAVAGPAFPQGPALEGLCFYQTKSHQEAGFLPVASTVLTTINIRIF